MKQKHNRRAGLTLTELLVVIAIIVIVTSVLAPLLSNSMEGREVREAARQVNAYFQQAQARAKELNRPVGVMIRRTPGPPNGTLNRDTDLDFGFQLSLAEEPPPYRGFTSTARANVEVNSNGTPTGIASLAPALQESRAFRSLVAPNDFIRFNLRGPKYRILNTQGNKIQFETVGHPPVRYSAKNSVTFEVFRRPQSINSTPLELPVGAGIVMNLSGVGLENSTPQGEEAQRDDGQRNSQGQVRFPRQKYIGLTEFQRPEVPMFRNMPLTIMFNPSGEVERIYRVLPTPGNENSTVFQQIPPKRPQDKIYLFLGRQGVDRWTNLDDGSNLWVTIDPANGLVTTAPNSIPLVPVASNPAATLIQKLGAVASSRQIAATGQSVGGQ